MFGFIIATVQLEMPFTLIRSIVVSTTVSRYVLYSVEDGGWRIAYQYNDTYYTVGH
jgi:hypothetical protein